MDSGVNPMPRSRPLAWGRLTAVALVFLGSGALLAVGSLLFLPLPRVRRRFRRWLFRTGSRRVLALLRIEVRVTGDLPKPPFVLVSNHLSYVDILVLASQVPAVFVSKAEVRRWPLLGLLTRGFGTIYIKREDRRDIPRVLALVEAVLARGEGVVLFPEGTSSPGVTVGHFRSPLLALPARAGLPVYTVALSYRTPEGAAPAHLAICWWGGMPLLPHLLGLFRLPGGEVLLDFGAEPIAEEDRKILAERLRQDVLSRFRPVVGEEEVPDPKVAPGVR